jgi:hypothetical protein
MKDVDDVIAGYCGLSHDDLPDWRWRNAFDDGLLPEEAVLLCLEEEGLYFGEME